MKMHGTRGSVMIITLTFILIMVVAAGMVLDLALTSYKLTMRNQLRAEGRSVAESEMEYMLYQFKEAVVSQAAATAAVAPAYLSTLPHFCDNAATPTTVQTPFLAAHQTAGWTVRRSMILETSLNGTIPGTTKIGTFTYVTARVEVIPPAASPFAGLTTIRVGRRLINSNTSLFQYSVFFQGDLELNPGSGLTTINGDVVANGNVYMGPRNNGAELRVNGKLRFLQGDYFNQMPDPSVVPQTTPPTLMTTYSNPTAPPPGVTLVAPVGADGATALTSTSSQVETQTSPENLLGGIDAAAEAKTRPDLFAPAGAGLDPTAWTAAQEAAAENNVYRSLIVPPPSAASSAEYPNGSTATADDDVINVRRAYTRADLVVTVGSTGAVTVATVVNGVPTDVTAQFATVIPNIGTSASTALYDEREGKNVNVTTIDVGALNTVISTMRTAGTFNFQGLLYVNLKNSSQASPAAVKLINAGTVPSVPLNTTTQAGGTGFSVATNGGMYVQGSYNTSLLKDTSGNPIIGADGVTDRQVPSMLMADAITVLSSNWVDHSATTPLSSRVASLSAGEVSNGNTMAVNAGLVTGNYASTGSSSSGGAQNLVRFMEDWSAKNVNFLGSEGRLFASTQYTAQFTGAAGTVYNQPARTFNFDQNIPTHPPPGNPTTTAFGRGDFFTW